MTRVHVRLSESLKVAYSRHLELSGSRVKPVAAFRGVLFSQPLPERKGYVLPALRTHRADE